MSAHTPSYADTFADRLSKWDASKCAECGGTGCILVDGYHEPCMACIPSPESCACGAPTNNAEGGRCPACNAR